MEELVEIAKILCYVFIFNVALSTVIWVFAHIKEIILISMPPGKLFGIVKGVGSMSIGYTHESFVWIHYISYSDGTHVPIKDNGWVYREGKTVRDEEIYAFVNSKGEATGVLVMGPKVLNNLHDRFMKINRDVLICMMIGALICLSIM